MFSAFEDDLREIDRRISAASSKEVPRLLDTLPIDVFVSLLLGVPAWLPNLRNFLPSMPPEPVQLDWTGASGTQTMKPITDYYRSLRAHVAALTSFDWQHMTVADYGCGWGRLTRLLVQHLPCDNIYAMDPWDRSLALCREYGVKGRLMQCDYVPTDLPVGDVRFHVINCFSVFTHLSERCHKTVLGVLRRYQREDGVLAVTIRPAEYWGDIYQSYPEGLTAESMRVAHKERGFAFIPHGREAVAGDISYGDTSISLDYIRSQWTDWRIAAVDWSMSDPYQVVVYLRPC